MVVDICGELGQAGFYESGNFCEAQGLAGRGAVVQGTPGPGSAPVFAEGVMFGRGRPGKSPDITGVEELRAEDLAGLKRGRVPAVKNLKDSHHMVARLLAIGLRPGEVADRTGYSRVRISILQADPSFQELMVHYRSAENEVFYEARDEYYDTQTSGRNKAARQIIDQLDEADESGEKIPLRTLLSIHDSFADRTGYGKRSTQVNINVDFAAKLDQAIKKANNVKTIDHEPARKVG